MIMAKLIKKSSEDQKKTSISSKRKTVIDRKEKNKTQENPLLSSPPLSMLNIVKFIDDNNEIAKLSANYGKVSESRIGLDELSDHDMFKTLFNR